MWGAWRGDLGLEPTVELYIAHLVEVFREVRRVLRKDGTLWLNIGDSYAASTKGSGGHNPKQDSNRGSWMDDRSWRIPKGLKPKDLLGIPWMLAFALRDDGWYLRSEITWAKRAPMPESVTDRPTTATEKVFLLTKSPRYFYDAEAIKEDATEDSGWAKRNMRNWWLLGPEPFPEAHFATFPTEIPRRAILAGTSAKGVCPKCGAGWERVIEKMDGTAESRASYAAGLGNMATARTRTRGNVYAGERETISWRPTCSCQDFIGGYYAVVGEPKPIPATVLDPFLGSGTTALVADQLGRDCIGIELNANYAAMAEKRLRDDAGMFASFTAREISP